MYLRLIEAMRAILTILTFLMIFYPALQTCVVSTTLNGQTRVLNMEQGNHSLVECLTNADAFVPKPAPEDADIARLFSSQDVSLQFRRMASVHWNITMLQYQLRASGQSWPSG